MLSWVLLALLLGGCLGLDFKGKTGGKIGPSWDVPVSIPLPSVRVEMKEVFDDIDGVDTVNDVYRWTFSDADPMEFSVGEIEVDPIELDVDVSFEDIGSVELSGLIDQEVTIADVPGGTINHQVGGEINVTLGDFTSVSFDENAANVLTVRIKNDEVTGFSAPGTDISRLEIVLVDADDEEIGKVALVTEDDEPWNPTDNTVREGTLDLMGKTLDSAVKVEVWLKANGDPSDKGDLAVELKLDKAHLSGATGIRIQKGQVPSLEFDVDVTLPDDAEGFTSMTVDEGELRFALQAPLGSNISFDIEDLKLDGQPLTLSGGAYDLAGTTISADPTLTVKLSIHGDHISFDTNDEFSVTGSLGRPGNQPFTLSSVTGTFKKDVEIELDEEIVQLDWPSDLTDLLDRLNLGDVTLTLVVNNGTGLTGHLSDLNLVANVGGDRKPVAGKGGSGWKDQTIQPNTETRIALHKDNSNIVDLLNDLPDEFVIGGKLIMKNEDGDITVSAGDEITVSFELVALMSVVIPKGGLEIVELDEPVEVEFDSKQQDLLRKAFKEHRLVIEVENHMPIGLTLELYLGHDKDHLYTDPATIMADGTIPQADIDENTGMVIRPERDTVLIEFDEDEFEDLFDESPLYLGAKVYIPGHDDDVTVTLGSEDYVEIKAYVTFTVRVNE